MTPPRTLLFVLLLSPKVVLGAESLTGVVKAGDGKGLSGVFVSAAHAGGTSTVTVFSDDSGQYRFSNLTSGVYSVSAHAGGFKTEQRSHIDIKDGQAARLDFKLSPETDENELLRQAARLDFKLS